MAYARLFCGNRWLPPLAVLTVLAFARPARAEPRTVAWTVTRAPDASSCPDGAALDEAVTRARGAEPPPEGARVQLDVTFLRGATDFAATVRARGPKGGSRTLTGPTCAALTDAVVATIAVLLDDDSEQPAPSPPSAAESPPADPPPAGVYLPLRIGLAAHGGLAYFHRSTSSPETMGA